MIDQTLVTTGFDTEALLSPRYISYILLAQVEAGLFPLNLHIERPPEPPDDPGLNLDVTIHPTADYDRTGYEAHPEAELPPESGQTFDVDILFEHESGADVLVKMFLTIVDNLTQQTFQGGLDLFVNLNLTFDEDDRGFQRNHQLALEVVDIGGLVVDLAEARGADREELLEEIKQAVERSVPFGVVDNAVQRVAIKKLRGGEGTRNAFGVYVNLALKTGPEPDEFLADRGEVENAQNFLSDGEDLAFATSSELYGKLGPDIRFRMAEEKDDGSGEFHFPLREDPGNTESDIVGKVKGIDVRPETILGPDNRPVPTGRLMIKLHGEYTDAPFDPDFRFKVLLRPKFEDGLLDWDIDTDIDLGLAGLVLALLGGIVVGLLTLNLGAGAGAFFALMVAKSLIAEPLIAGMLADEIDEDDDLSFLDAIPHRVRVANRRWDPLYVTRHQVVTLLDAMQINFDGLAFQGRASLGKEPRPRRDAFLRDEERNEEGEVTHLRYRVNDFTRFEADFEAIAPGTDRRPFRRANPEAEPTLVSLTGEEIANRVIPDRADGPVRVLAPIALSPRRVHVHQGQIDDILCITRREINEERGRLIDEFRTATKAQISDNQGEQIREELAQSLEDELGRPPTDEELDKAVDERLEALVDEAQVDFEEDELPDLLNDAIVALLRFDMAPEEFAARQQAGALFIEGKEIIVRQGKPYYRDRPDGDPNDNLLALPRYQPPFSPPSPPDEGGLPELPGEGEVGVQPQAVVRT